jgi:hypothetical protein
MLLYELRSATVALIHENTRYVAITVPSGTILNVPDNLATAAPLVKVEWDGKSIQIFAVDLRDRGELIKTFSP